MGPLTALLPKWSVSTLKKLEALPAICSSTREQDVLIEIGKAFILLGGFNVNLLITNQIQRRVRDLSNQEDIAKRKLFWKGIRYALGTGIWGLATGYYGLRAVNMGSSFLKEKRMAPHVLMVPTSLIKATLAAYVPLVSVIGVSRFVDSQNMKTSSSQKRLNALAVGSTLCTVTNLVYWRWWYRTSFS